MTTFSDAPAEGEFALGHGHYGRVYGWHPDRELNPQYDGIPDIERAGIVVRHPAFSREPAGLEPGVECASSATFDVPGAEVLKADPAHRWQVESWDPLTLSPSLLCRRCGDHGHIVNGEWRPA